MTMMGTLSGLTVIDLLEVDRIIPITDTIEMVGDVEVMDGDLCVVDSSDHEGLCFQIERPSNSNTSSRVFHRERTDGQTGFSSIYAGSADPILGGTAFTLPSNRYYFIRHSSSETGDIVWWAERANDNMHFNRTIYSGGGRIRNTTRYTTTQTIPVTDDQVFCNTDGAAWTATLPAGAEGQSFRIINSGDSGNDLTITPNGAEHLLGANASQTLKDHETLELCYNATDGWE